MYNVFLFTSELLKILMIPVLNSLQPHQKVEQMGRRSRRGSRRSRSSRSSRKGKSRSSKPSLAVILAKVGLQRLQPVLEAQEVDLPALLELDDKVGLSRKVKSSEFLIVSMSKDLRELGLVDSKEREMLREQLEKIKRK